MIPPAQAPVHVAVAREVRYGADPAQTLDLYANPYDTAARRPVIVWVHGGGFSAGDKRAGYTPQLARDFVRRGYVSLSIDYRILVHHSCDGMPADCRAAALEDARDAQAAIRWVRRNAATRRLDPARVAIAGGSAGGMIAYLVATRPAPGARVRAFASLAGGWPGGAYASRGDAPGLLFHTTGDPVQPYRWSVQAARALRGAGVAARLVTLRSAGHVVFPKYRRVYEQGIGRFLHRVL